MYLLNKLLNMLTKLLSLETIKDFYFSNEIILNICLNIIKKGQNYIGITFKT